MLHALHPRNFIHKDIALKASEWYIFVRGNYRTMIVLHHFIGHTGAGPGSSAAGKPG